jgi:hypothetical protein
MRYLAIAKLRMLTQIRTASALFAIAAIPSLIFCILTASLAENEYRAAVPFYAQIIAPWGFILWILHAGMLLIGSESSGQLHPLREGAEWSDLMETIPVGPNGRFLGEALGSLGANLTIHLCCMPLLAMVAVLSPLPLSAFIWLEIVTLVLFGLAGAAAAWKRCARPSKWSGTRMVRSGLLFWVLFWFILDRTSRWDAITSSLYLVTSRPLLQSWAEMTAAIDRPALFASLVALLCISYVMFYYFSAVRGLARRKGSQ